MRRFLGRLMVVTALFVTLVLGVGLAAHLQLLSAEERMSEAWRENLGGRTFPERYPQTTANETALRLQKIAAGLGVELPPRDFPWRPKPDARTAERSWKARDFLSETQSGLPQLPREVEGFLRDAQPGLRAAVALLLEEPAPVWQEDVAAGRHANLISLLHLQKLLLLEAAAQVRAGARQTAVETLEASLRLNEAILDRADLFSQLVAHAVLRHELPVLRRFCGAPRDWEARLAELHLRPRTRTALHLQSFEWQHAARRPKVEEYLEGFLLPTLHGWPEEEPPFEELRFFRPLVRWGLRGAAVRQHMLQEAGFREEVRTLDPSALYERHLDRIPRWQWVAHLVLSDQLQLWIQSARLELSVELTARVLEARALIAEGRAQELFEADGEPSRVEGLSWRYQAGEPAAVRIYLDGDLAQPVRNPLPLDFTVRAGQCPGS